MLRYEDAISIVDRTVTQVLDSPGSSTGERVPLGQALGRVAAASVSLDRPVPASPTSIKDGYAVRAADTPGTLSLVARPVFAAAQPAAAAQSFELEAGKAVYVATGGVLPRGADAVLEIERAQVSPADDGSKRTIEVRATLRAGEDVRAPGSDAKVGELVVRKGQVIRPAHIGLLAMAGCASVEVCSRPLVAIAATGDELVDAGMATHGQSAASLLHGQIYDCNRPMLIALAQDPTGANARVLDLGIVRDTSCSISSSSSSSSHSDPSSLTSDSIAGAAKSDPSPADDTRSPIDIAIDQAIEAQVDVLITSGGVSVGQRDFVGPALEQRGEVLFSSLRLKPGKPTTFATIPRGSASHPRAPLLVFALPGNPCSAFVMFNILAVPALKRMSGQLNDGHRGQTGPLLRVPCVLATDLRRDSQRAEYHRVRLALSGDGSELVAHSTGVQRSSRLMSLQGAVALVVVDPGQGVLPAGTRVSAIVVDDLRVAPELHKPKFDGVVPFGPTTLRHDELCLLGAGIGYGRCQVTAELVRRAILSHTNAGTTALNTCAAPMRDGSHLGDVDSFRRWLDTEASEWTVAPRLIVLLVPSEDQSITRVAHEWMDTSSGGRIAVGFGERMREAACAVGDTGTGLLGSDCVAVCVVNGKQHVVVSVSVAQPGNGGHGAVDIGTSLQARIGAVWDALGQLAKDVSEIK